VAGKAWPGTAGLDAVEQAPLGCSRSVEDKPGRLGLEGTGREGCCLVGQARHEAARLGSAGRAVEPSGRQGLDGLQGHTAVRSGRRVMDRPGLVGPWHHLVLQESLGTSWEGQPGRREAGNTPCDGSQAGAGEREE